MIDVEGLVFTRQGRLVVDAVSFQVPDGTVCGVVGPNGSGKTTLVRLLYGSLRPDAGRISVDGRPLDTLSRRHIAQQIAVVSQTEHAESALTITDSVMLGRLPHRPMLAAATAEDYRACAEALNRVGIADLATRRAGQVSGGEAQRALIARAVAQHTPHIILDEPTNHLDVRHQHEVLRTVRELGATVVLVLHDLNLAAAYCDRVLLLDRGRAVASGPPGEVLTAANLEGVYQVSVDVFTLASGRPHLVMGERPLQLTTESKTA